MTAPDAPTQDISLGRTSTTIEESEEQKIERLGRERPPGFRNAWSEIGFVFAVAMSQILTEYFVSVELEIPDSVRVWPATAFSLSIASTLLFFGRLGDKYGGRIIYLIGLMWLVVWSLIAGFSQNWLMGNLGPFFALVRK